MTTLYRSVQIIDPQSPFNRQVKDILCDEKSILSIEDKIKKTDVSRVVEANNYSFSPSFFDSQVSFGEPGFEERESLANGCDTAFQSGFGTIALMPNTQPVVDQASLVKYLLQQTQHQPVEVNPIGCFTQGMQGEHMAELFDMHHAGSIAFSDDTHAIDNANLLKIGLQYVQSFGGIIYSFPKQTQIARNAQVNESFATTKLGLKSQPSIAESLQIARDLHILEYTGGKLHIPLVSTKESVDLIRKAKQQGLQVSCSVAVHHLYFTDEALTEFDSAFKVNPPLRSENDRLALIEGLKDGTIDMVTTDHRPREIEAKKVEFEHAAYGSIGLESCFGACNKVLGKELSIEKLTQSRQIFGLKTPKVAVGEALNFTLIDTEKSYVFSEEHILSSNKNAIFLGEELKGKVVETIVVKS